MTALDPAPSDPPPAAEEAATVAASPEPGDAETASSDAPQATVEPAPASVVQAPDTASPDTASPDTATPDAATPDTASPDTATPDAATPDAVASPDAAASPETGFGAGVWRMVTFTGVCYELPDPNPEMVLRESEAPWRELRVPIAMAEGNAIAYAWRGIELPRPFTHDLLVDVLERHRTSVEVLRLTARRNGVFFAELETAGPNGRQIFPCRPSDGVAVVLRKRPPAPILVADWVFGADDD